MIGIREARKRGLAGVKVGDTFTTTRTFTQADVVCFGEISKDYNPVHFDQQFAQAGQFTGRICHGLLVASMVTEIGGQLGWLASGMRFDFKKPVYPGDRIECRLTIAALAGRRVRSEAVFVNQHGMTVMEAVVEGVVPDLRGKEVLQEMIAQDHAVNAREP
ncbi:MAG: MaoC/PaaZ C-terminal domain-containing protein [Desulfatiglandaceae bacterium]